MSKTASKPNSVWATGKRRELDDAKAKKAGYPSNLHEEHGWRNGARATRRVEQ